MTTLNNDSVFIVFHGFFDTYPRGIYRVRCGCRVTATTTLVTKPAMHAYLTLPYHLLKWKYEKERVI